ncbi:MAG: AMP-binding protein [Candidatus Neomarinimicrobiota bacterium]
MKPTLEKRIYKAQSLGNVEPIEHMVPYPNLRALIDGQNVKYSNKMVYEDSGLTSKKLFSAAQQTAHWLKDSGVRGGDRVLMDGLDSASAIILAFGIWTLGAALVLSRNNDRVKAQKAACPAMTVTGNDKFRNKIKSFPAKFEPDYKPLLLQEAVVYWSNNKGIRLSHYNLLINANGVHLALNLDQGQTFMADLNPDTTAWIILQAILPLYSGTALTSHNPDIVLGLPGQFENADFIIDFDWHELKNHKPPHLTVCPENTAFLSLNREALHMTAFDGDNKPHKIKGHAVMMGYLKTRENEVAFKSGGLLI